MEQRKLFCTSESCGQVPSLGGVASAFGAVDVRVHALLSEDNHDLRDLSVLAFVKIDIDRINTW
jgi:hypothetical protein